MDVSLVFFAQTVQCLVKQLAFVTGGLRYLNNYLINRIKADFNLAFDSLSINFNITGRLQ